jgi:hypothetical protein
MSTSELDQRPTDERVLEMANAMAPLSAPAATAVVADHLTRQRIVEGLKKRADWLRKEYLNGGDFQHLHTREQECRAIAEMITEGRV